MAFCPKCSRQIQKNHVVCPHCGYDFPGSPPAEPDSMLRNLVFGRLGTAALIVGQVFAGIGCLMSLVGCAIALLDRRLFDALVEGPITFFLLFAMFVVFVRAQRAST